MTDKEIFLRCKAGDSLCWEIFVRKHQQRVFTIASAYATNRDDARDLAQDIFIKIYKNLSKCNDHESLLPWLNAVARNTAIDTLRRHSRHGSTSSSLDELQIESSDPTPEESCVLADRKEVLHKSINSLDLIYREILMLKEMQQLSLTEISIILDIPVGTVKSRLFNARIQLTKAVNNLLRSEVCDVSF